MLLSFSVLLLPQHLRRVEHNDTHAEIRQDMIPETFVAKYPQCRDESDSEVEDDNVSCSRLFFS